MHLLPLLHYMPQNEAGRQLYKKVIAHCLKETFLCVLFGLHKFYLHTAYSFLGIRIMGFL